MESKKLIIVFVWIFFLMVTVMQNLVGFGMSFVGYLIIFFIALVSSFAVETLIPEKEKLGDELQNELQDLRSRLDDLSRNSS
jgi:hypothetical protein